MVKRVWYQDEFYLRLQATLADETLYYAGHYRKPADPEITGLF